MGRGKLEKNPDTRDRKEKSTCRKSEKSNLT